MIKHSMIAEVLPRGNRKSSMCSMHACHDQFHKDEMSNHGFLRTSAPTLRPFLCQCLAFHRCPHKGYSQSKWQRSWCSKWFDLIILICMHQKVFCLHYVRPPNPQHPAPDSTLHWYLFKVARVVTLEIKNITIYRSINSISLRSVLFRGIKSQQEGEHGWKNAFTKPHGVMGNCVSNPSADSPAHLFSCHNIRGFLWRKFRLFRQPENSQAATASRKSLHKREG